MPYADLPLDHPSAPAELPVGAEEFDAFWTETLLVTRKAGGAPDLRPVRDSPLTTPDPYDVRFPGRAGHPVAAWSATRCRGDNHTMAAAARARNGHIVTAVNAYHFTGGPCAELVLIGAAAAQGVDAEESAPLDTT